MKAPVFKTCKGCPTPAACKRGIGLLRDGSNVLLKAAEYLEKWDC